MSQTCRQLALALGLLLAVPVGRAAAEPKRPKITGIANFAAKVDSLDEARKFYGGVVGFAEAFTTKDPAGEGERVAFKVNDTQFVELSPTLKGDEDRRSASASRLPTRAAPRLPRGKASVPKKVDADANGNRSFVVTDPDGHAIQFVKHEGLGAPEGHRQAPLAHAHLRPHPARRLQVETPRPTPSTRTSSASACGGRAARATTPSSGSR
jgi:catechol 2,3-dioxygenase-like lactoylglutathione lyase family enzyme